MVRRVIKLTNACLVTTIKDTNDSSQLRRDDSDLLIVTGSNHCLHRVDYLYHIENRVRMPHVWERRLQVSLDHSFVILLLNGCFLDPSVLHECVAVHMVVVISEP